MISWSLSRINIRADTIDFCRRGIEGSRRVFLTNMCPSFNSEPEITILLLASFSFHWSAPSSQVGLQMVPRYEGEGHIFIWKRRFLFKNVWFVWLCCRIGSQDLPMFFCSGGFLLSRCSSHISSLSNFLTIFIRTKG